MLRYSFFCLIFYLDFLIFPAILNEIDTQQEANHVKHPYKHFGQHYEYIYETPSSPDQRPKFLLSYDSIGGDQTDMAGNIKQIGNSKNHKPKKHWQSNAKEMQFLDAEAEQFQHQSENSDITDFPQKISNLYFKNAWKENENARKRTQEEYEIVHRLASDIFDQAQEEMSKFPTFDISRFRKLFSRVADVPASLLENSFPERRANPAYGSNRFQLRKEEDKNISKKFQPLQRKNDVRRMSENAKHKMKSDKDRRWTKNGALKKSQNDGSYQLFGTLPKFDPRFPFDRAYKLMDGLRSPELLKFPSTNFHI